MGAQKMGDRRKRRERRKQIPEAVSREERGRRPFQTQKEVLEKLRAGDGRAVEKRRRIEMKLGLNFTEANEH